MSIKKILALGLILGALLFWYSHAHANPDSNPTNPIDSLNPASGTYGSAAYPGQLYNFLAKEDANRYSEQGFGNFVVSGCLGITSAGLIMTPSSCIAYNAGYRSTETGAITFVSGQTYWVAMDENTSGSNAGLTNFARAGSTHYLIDSVDVTQPTMPTDAQLLMKVTTAGGAITVVTDLRILVPNFVNLGTLHANLNANSFRITGLGVPAASGDALSEGAPIGAKVPAAGTFTAVTDNTLASGQCVQTTTGGLLSVTGSACSSATGVPNGNSPQIVGYSGLNTPESETVSGDFAFVRAGANSYTVAVTKVNGNPVASTGPTAGQIWIENAGATSMTPLSISGDCTVASTGAITCTKINGVTPGGTCTNQFVTVISASGVPTCTTATLASAQYANQGTTTTTLHGNAAGNPSFGAVSLTTDVTGTLPVGNGGTGSTVFFTPPGGRLTLTTATPVMTADATAQGTIFYDSYVGNTVPVAGVQLAIGSNEISLILDVTNQTSGNLYDVFAINVSGTLTLCAGPAWTNSTTRSQAIALSGGVWTNSGSMTHCFNNAVDKGPISGNAGTYLGTFETSANAQTGMQFHPAAAAGGAAAKLYLYNAYNRVWTTSDSLESTASWTYGTSTWRAADNSNSNRITFVDGLGQSFVSATYACAADFTANTPSAFIGVDENSTSAAPRVFGSDNQAAQIIIQATDDFSPVLGLNFMQAMEWASGATITFTGSSGSQYLKIRLMM